jgi:phosphopantothenoylcysteine decarboxylase/phosphopantothenate--cysteine ligase
MRIIVTAGPTREHIDSVRFITNASSGQMGCAVAAAAVRAGHEVTLLLGEGSSVCLEEAELAKIAIAPFVSVQDLKAALEQRFAACDALVMAAAVGDFRPEKALPFKLRRRSGPVTIKLYPTEDILADLGRHKQAGQVIVAFAVEDAAPETIEAKARGEMIEKNADFVVVNTPAAMAADHSYACILSRDATVLPWADRAKETLAEEIVSLLRRD